MDSTKNKSASLIIDQLSVRYPGVSQNTVEDVSFSLKPQTINVLIGPNGSGKSTLLKAILGILPSQGSIKISANSKYDNFGYVPQRLGLDLSLPLLVDEFLKLTLVGCHHQDQKEEFITQALALVEADQFRYKKLGDLSGGQLQRVILARALIHQPQILILDEPEAGIDFKGEQLFYDLLKELVVKKNLTALVASHEMEIVHQYADQVLCINKTLICSGKPKQTLTTQNLNKLYGLGKKIYHHGCNH